MKNTFLSISLIVLLSFLSGTNAQNTRSMWVWGSSASIIEYPSTRENFFNFCENPPGYDDPNAIEGFPHQINLVYLSANYHMSGDSVKRATLHDFLKEAHSKGIRVEYLGGDASWATSNQESGKERINSFYAFNSEAKDSTEKFDGAQYDVEPYLLSGWSDANQKMEIWNGYIELMTYCQAKVDSLGDDTYFGAAIPRWFDSNPGIQYLHQLQDIIDYVAIMDYVDDSRRLIGDAGAEILYANQINKKVIVGVETQKINPTSVTFYEEGWGNMENELYDLYNYFKDNSGFSGIAIHHYDYYQKFPKFGSNGKDLNPPVLLNSSFIDTVSAPYFSFNIVDICGVGIDAAKIAESASVVYEAENSDDSVGGNWENNTPRFLNFHPENKLKSGKYNFIFNLIDSSGNSAEVSASLNITVSGVKKEDGSKNYNYNILRNYPNPFNPSTKIEFTINKTNFTTLNVYNLLGKKVDSLISKELSPGKYSVTFNGINLSSGIYLCVLSSGERTVSKKMMLLK